MDKNRQKLSERDLRLTLLKGNPYLWTGGLSTGYSFTATALRVVIIFVIIYLTHKH